MRAGEKAQTLKARPTDKDIRKNNMNFFKQKELLKIILLSNVIQAWNGKHHRLSLSEW